MTCEQWLSEIISKNGFMLVQDVQAAAKENGFSKVELKKAKKNLGIKTHHFFDEKEATENWYWHSDEYFTKGGNSA